MIEIDGSILEGGGQIVRTSVALSALLGKDVHIRNVRMKRSPPGLKAQHLTAVKAVATLAKAEVIGLKIGSTDIVFKPKGRTAGSFTFDVGTAGSIPLVLQALMPTAFFAPEEVSLNLIGGTNCQWSPPIDYLSMIMLPILAKMGCKAEIFLKRRGHYPKGGGQVFAKIKPVEALSPIQLTDTGEVEEIYGISYCVKLPKHVAERQAESAISYLKSKGYANNISIKLEWYPPEKDPHLSPGSGVILCCRTSSGAFLGADSLGERGRPAEVVGKEAASKLIEEISSKMPIDRHMGDMLIPYMAIADGESKIGVSKITLHTLTNIAVTEKIVGVKFRVKGSVGQPGEISVEGIGLKKGVLNLP